ncbi:adhesion G protein-coupled receptor E1-like [Megalops cyprinoides]|uniref:adhesion G protein-coupled receptor E1-like n=1 Tax=Megalops cyprinoides TaxID=118141 RepID=UPI001863B7C2|nr:adhesion G protein-coupled receptor E1-like [Megalops cyprinoides]
MQTVFFSTVLWGALVLWKGAEQIGDFQVRLVDGKDSCSGRVEVLHNKKWGTVCDDGWDMNDARVVCREVDCGSAKSAPGNAHFGPGTGTVWMGQIQCSGHEDSLKDCSNPSFGASPCPHSRDAGVVCSGVFKVRLVNGTDSCSGRVEVFHDNNWGTVCDDGWDMNDARVVCREVDCGSAKEAKGNGYFGPGTGEIWDIQCSGSEGSIEECSQNRTVDKRCPHSQDAGVVCSDRDECKDTSVCGPNANCSNTVGSYTCSCHHGYRAPLGVTLTSSNHPCQDIDECTDTSVCGPNATCSNTVGGYSCSCHHGYRAPPGVTLTNSTYPCQGGTEGEGECKDKSEEQCQLDSLDNLLDNSSSLTQETLLNVTLRAVDLLSQWKEEVREKEIDVALKIPEKLASALVKPTQTQSSCNLSTEKLEVQTFAIGPEASLTETPQLKSRDNLLKIDLLTIAKNNNGSGAVVFIAYSNMEVVLKAEFFHTERKTNKTIKTMMSNVVSASLPNTKNTMLPEPVNFTLRHLTQVDPEGNLSCVYWNQSRWIVDGCEARDTNATHTVCTCNHLSTFALIMQTDRPPEDDIILKWISMIALSVGLLCLALAILTFILCHWNPKVSNTARLNLSICLFLAHLLFLLVQSFLSHIQHKLVCAVISGVLHFLFLSSFVWMFLEALQLFLLVRNLQEVRVIQQEGIHWGFLLLIGYSIPCLVVGVSAGLVPEGYGNNQCWLQTDKGFRWSFLGPVCFVLAVNVILFITIIGYLRFALAGRNKEISQLKDTRMMVVKILFQFIILGCPWIFGFFVNNSKVLEYLFLLITSQQGTFIFLVHCVFRKEVQEQYRQWWKNICGSKDASESSHSFTTFTTSQTATK